VRPPTLGSCFAFLEGHADVPEASRSLLRGNRIHVERDLGCNADDSLLILSHCAPGLPITSFAGLSLSLVLVNNR
jgi:hypothetical protein